MKIYLITEEQIKGLYRSVSAGSRDFERVIQAILGQEVTEAGAAELLRLKE